MKIVQTYSHFNGLEHLLVHKEYLWNEVQQVIQSVDGHACGTKVSKGKTMAGAVLFSPIAMNTAFATALSGPGWAKSRIRNGRGAHAVPLVLVGVEP